MLEVAYSHTLVHTKEQKINSARCILVRGLNRGGVMV